MSASKTRLSIIVAVAAAALQASSPCKAEAQATTAERLVAQNSLFKDQYRDDLVASPESRTSLGDYSDNARLDDRSLKAALDSDRQDRAYAKKLAHISTAGFPEQDRLSHELLLRELRQRIEDYNLKTYEMPLTQFNGVHTDLADLPKSVPLDSVQHYEDYVARLKQIPRVFAEVIEVLKQGEKDGLTPPALLLRQVPAQCRGIIAEDPFLSPLGTIPSSIDAEDRARLTAQITAVVKTQVLPAYDGFCHFIEADYMRHGRSSIGLSDLPDGPHRYEVAVREQTTTTLTPAQINALGLSEIERINGLLAQLAHRAGYPDLPAFRKALNSDPKYIPTSAEAIVADFKHYVTQMEPRLPELFLAYPTTGLAVEAVPASQPQMATHHVDGTPDGSRAGRIVVATSDYAHRKLLSDETQAYHEGVPGHELQISIQQRLTGLPKFRATIRNNAYVEGWAVYAEGLGKELGYFQDPASDYGRLNLELLRAVRLVIDTGIHSRGWSRDQAVAFFRQSGAADEPTIQAEVDRYIAIPAQGLSYKVGQLKILELRALAERDLGARFDIRAFHQAVLGAGSLPLDLLETRVRTWIKSEPLKPGTMGI